MRFTVVMVLFPVLAFAAPELSSGNATREIRGVWVTRWDFLSAEDVRSAVKRCAHLGFNRLYVQVRGRSDAFYRSRLEPWGEELGGGDPGFDPLQVAIDEARRVGVEIHAWVNVLSGWKGSAPPRDPRHVVHAHPEWFLQERSGRRLVLGAQYTMLNPCLPEVRAYLVRVIKDIAERYDVDGVHLDYVRFVFDGMKETRGLPFDAKTLDVFRGFTGSHPDRSPTLWDAFRRLSIDALVAATSDAVRQVRPRSIVSAAVLPDLRRGRELFLQDATKWRSQGWVDEIVPMSYEVDTESFARSTYRALERCGQDTVFPGIGAYRFTDAESLRSQVSMCRSLRAPGYVVFSFASFYPTPSPESVRQRGQWKLRQDLRAAMRALNELPPAMAATAAEAP